MRLIDADKLIEKLGLSKCDSCRFGGTYCVDCKYVDGHSVLDAINEQLKSKKDANILPDGKLYLITGRYKECCGCKNMWGYDEIGYVLCKRPKCLRTGE